jgi:hypothetical protein
MKFFLASLLLTFLAVVSSQGSVNPPELKFAFNYDIVDALKYTLVKPLFDNYTQNLQIQKPFSTMVATLNITLSNIWIQNITLDWKNTHLLIPDDHSNPSIVIKNLSAFVMFDGNAKGKLIHLKEKNNTLEVSGVDVTISLGFGTYPNETSYAFIASQEIVIGTFTPHLTSSFAQCLVLIAELVHIPIGQVVQFAITEQFKTINETIIQKSAQGLSIGLLDMFEVDLSLADLPFVYKEGKQSFQAGSVNLAITNNITKQGAPVSAADLMPNYVDNSLEVQLLVSENMIEQLLWTAFQSGKVDVVLSSANMPKTIPIQLNTSAINIILPNVTRDYGKGKGMYLELSKGGDYPLAFIRDGRILAKLAMLLDFYVDNDGTNYPAQGLKNCTTCEKAVSINATFLAAAVLYKVNQTNIGVNVMNAGVVQMENLVGDTDANGLMTTLNNLLVPIVSQINTQLQDGIANPLIGKYGINDTSINVETDFMMIGLSMDPSSFM